VSKIIEKENKLDGIKNEHYRNNICALCLLNVKKIDSTLTDVIKVMILKRVPIHSMKFVPFIIS